MPNKCYYCKEIKPCRKEYYFPGDYFSCLIFPFKWICKDCSDAIEILAKKDFEEKKNKEKKYAESWIKQRDKLLKEKI